jgi:hypothetical protein
MKIVITLIALLFITACDEAKNTPPSVQVKTVHNSGTCAIGKPKNAELVLASESLHVFGWAYDGESMTSPAHVQIKLLSVNGLNTKTFDATRVKRPDLVSALKNTSIEMAGVNLTVPPNTLAPGKYDIIILQDEPNYIVQCTKRFKFEVVEKLPPVQATFVISAPLQSPVTESKPETKLSVSKKKAKKITE